MKSLAFLNLIAALLTATVCAPGCGPKHGVTKVHRADVTRNTTEARTLTNRAFESMLKGDDKSARPLLEKALALDSEYGPAMNDLGVLEYRAGRLYDAAWRFESAIKLMPHNPEPENNLGLVFESAGKFAEAEKHYDAASAMDLQNVEFAANRARVRVRQGKTDTLTRQLLDYVQVYDPRPEWRDWARLTLTRLRTDEPPTTQHTP